ncbi:alpha/beta hydrolase [Mycobacterium bourgelatii]|uniref:Lipase n=1 Tax=Mycobacterium bourgelatii TaxID=1273442 RepID=A0A7I9YYQ0_MYCBU|nr:alpha/beta hydrolase [Mycobacterium bourgelatii]MCV6976327.1 alpha/beta hydrolase [Mycobacterium bourgelatii]GFG93765.1 lipase [Mycobacterium bourgelatii]
MARSKTRPIAATNAALRMGVFVLPRLPDRVKRVLAGGKPITIDGNTLDATAQLVLTAQRLTRTGGLGASGDPAVARALMRDSHVAMAPRIAVPTTDFSIPGPAGELRTRHYRPPVKAEAPLLVFFHGGGFVVGDIESHDGLCRMICRDAAIHVLSVEYRLAPEHKAPAAVDDCVAAYRWALGHAADLGASRIAIGGDSAGGTLTVLVALRSRDEGLPQPALQVLWYPAVDLSGQTRSRELFSDGFFISKQEIDWFTDSFLGGTDIATDDPLVSPLQADLAGLPPALVFTGGFDPLRDEGNEYAAALRRAGITVHHRQFDSLPHGFASLAPLGGDSADAIAATISAVGTYLSGRSLADDHPPEPSGLSSRRRSQYDA